MGVTEIVHTVIRRPEVTHTTGCVSKPPPPSTQACTRIFSASRACTLKTQVIPFKKGSDFGGGECARQ